MAQAIQFTTTGGPEVLELKDVELKEPMPGEVRIANAAIGLNFIDIYFRTGLYPTDLPSGLGQEGAGIIDAIGNGVKGFAVGDRVAYVGGPLGAYAEYHTLPTTSVIKLPDAIDCAHAAAAMLKGLTAQYLLRQTYRLKGDETILLHAAAGGVGSIACQWAAALGVKVIGTVSTPEKAKRAQRNGAWKTINYSNENVVERVRELTDGKMCPVVYDSVGAATWETSLDCLAPRGLMVSYGNSSGSVEGVNLAILNKKGSLFVTRPSLFGYMDTRKRFETMCADLFSVMTKGKVTIDVGQRYTLADAGRAQQALADRLTTGSTILIP